MTEGQNPTAPVSLTVDSAASIFEGLISKDETPDAAENAPEGETPEAPEAEAEVEAEAEESTEESEAEDAEDDEAEEAPEEKEPEPRSFRVKVDGEEVEVTEDELLKGYSRTADYTRKTQALSEERKSFLAEADAVRSERQKYSDSLEKLANVLKTNAMPEPDWNQLREENPEEFATQWAVWQQQQQRLQAVEQERQRTQQKAQEDEVKRLVEYTKAEHERLLDAVPAWKDPEVETRDLSDLKSFAKSRGFSDSDLNAVRDHRVVLLLRDAMLHEKAQKQRPIAQKKIESVKAATPGPARSQTKTVSAAKKAHAKLAKTGRLTDAASVFETMFGDD